MLASRFLRSSAAVLRQPNRFLCIPPVPPGQTVKLGSRLKQRRKILQSLHKEKMAKKKQPYFLKRIHNMEQYYFRGYSVLRVMLGGCALGFIYVYIFREDIVENISSVTATITSRSLEREEVTKQAELLSKTVIRQVLDDSGILEGASVFVKGISARPDIKEAIVTLLTMICEDETAQTTIETLASAVVEGITQDKEVRKHLVELTIWLLNQEFVTIALTNLLIDVTKEPSFVNATSNLMAWVFSSEIVVNQASDLANHAVTELLNDQYIQARTSQFVHDVLEDEALHQQGGEALWQSFKYSLPLSSIWKRKPKPVSRIEIEEIKKEEEKLVEIDSADATKPIEATQTSSTPVISTTSSVPSTTTTTTTTTTITSSSSSTTAASPSSSLSTASSPSKETSSTTDATTSSTIPLESDKTNMASTTATTTSTTTTSTATITTATVSTLTKTPETSTTTSTSLSHTPITSAAASFSSDYEVTLSTNTSLSKSLSSTKVIIPAIYLDASLPPSSSSSSTSSTSTLSSSSTSTSSVPPSISTSSTSPSPPSVSSPATPPLPLQAPLPATDNPSVTQVQSEKPEVKEELTLVYDKVEQKLELE